MKIIEKAFANIDMPYSLGHFVNKGEQYFKGNYLKLILWKSLTVKQCKIITADLVLLPDETYDTYVDQTKC